MVWASLQTADRCTSPGPWVWARPRLSEHRSHQPRHNTGTQVGNWHYYHQAKQWQLFSKKSYLTRGLLTVFPINFFSTSKIFSIISLLYKNKTNYENTLIVDSVSEKNVLKHCLQVNMLLNVTQEGIWYSYFSDVELHPQMHFISQKL